MIDIKNRIPLRDKSKVGKYTIVRKLYDGEGGFGMVYLGKKEGENRKYAIKEFYCTDIHERNPKTQEIGILPYSSTEIIEVLEASFAIEQTIIRDHLQNGPNIPNLYETINAYGTAYYTMDYIDGTKVVDLVRNGGITADELSFLVRDICKALEFCHQNGVLHMDISYNNILMATNRHSSVTTLFWLIDFGNALYYSPEMRRKHDMQKLPAAKTPGFTDPKLFGLEQMAFTPQYDLFSLGKVVEYVLSNSKHITGERKEEFEAFVRACTHEEIRYRPCCVKEALRLLERRDSEGYLFSPVSMELDSGKYYFHTPDGIIEYDRIRPFRYGYAAFAVSNGTDGDLKWGFIDTLGNIVVENIYDSVSDVFHGIAHVCTGDSWATVRIPPVQGRVSYF